MGLLTTLSLAQVSSEFSTPDIRRVGMRLACLCGSCKNSVGDCPMLACHYSLPAREKIRDMEARGMNDDAIVAEFVKTEGKRSLVTPPAEGFNILAWWTPPAAVAFGLVLIFWFIRRTKRHADAHLQEIDPKVLDRYRDAIDKDIAGLDG